MQCRPGSGDEPALWLQRSLLHVSRLPSAVHAQHGNALKVLYDLETWYEDSSEEDYSMWDE